MSPILGATLVFCAVAVHDAAASPLLSPVEIPGAPALDPNLAKAARALGESHLALERGDLPGAEKALARARDVRELAGYVELFQARLLLLAENHTAAAEAARRGVAAYEGSPIEGAFAEILGNALAATGDEAGARDAWKRALARTVRPERQDQLRVAILASHDRSGTPPAAIQGADPSSTLVRDTTSLPPRIRLALQSPSEKLRRGEDLTGRGLCAEAIEEYDGALAGELSNPDRRRALLGRSHCQFRIRRYEEALAGFASLRPDPEARFWYARSLARTGQRQRAIARFEEIGRANDPEYGSWALYLAATLLEDRGQDARATALYQHVASREGSSERALDALWRVGWAAYRGDDFALARTVFLDLAGRAEGLDRLRPRYWAARAAQGQGQAVVGKNELAQLAAEYPLTYYGWRAGERLKTTRGASDPARPARLPSSASQIDATDTLRAELLVEAGLDELARGELDAIADHARSLGDRTNVARLYAQTGDYFRAQRLVVDAYAEPLSQGLQPRHRALWWLSWPPAYREIVDRALPEDAAIDRSLVWAIMREESSYRPQITSPAGARGLLQIMPETAEHLARENGLENFDPADLYDPPVSIRLGSAYLNELRRRFPDRMSAAIGSYNAGPRAVRRWLRGDQAHREDDVWVEDIPYPQTRSYVKRVLRSLHVYRTFYGPNPTGS